MADLFDRYRSALKSAIADHYPLLLDSTPNVYGYSLYTVSDVPSIGPVANRSDSLSVPRSDALYHYYRYGAVEWSEWDDFGLFATVNSIVAAIHTDDTHALPMRRDRILSASLDTLAELESSGLFGPRSADRFVVICVADSDHAIMRESAQRLNSPDVFAAYCSALD